MENIHYLEDQIIQRRKEAGLGDPDGLEKINQGNNRIIYRVRTDIFGEEVKGDVIKIGFHDSVENRQEVRAWQNYSGTRYEKYLMPILDYSERHLWIRMPYGEPVPEGLADQDLINVLEEMGGTDISPDDFVYYKGNSSGQRCCDYASL